MLRTHAVRQILLEDIAGIPHGTSDHRGDPNRPKLDDSATLLERARRRNTLVVVLDWIALLVLVFVRARSAQVLDIGPSEDSIFSLGLLAIAAHSGFRLGRLEKLHAVRRALDGLSKRSQTATGPSEPR